MTSTSGSALASPPGADDRDPLQQASLSSLTVLALLRPWYWPVSLGPMALGYVLGSGSWPPPAGSAGQHIGAALVLGPLVWGAVLVMNDRYDVAGDSANPRRAATPTVTGAVGVRDLGRLQIFFVTASLVVAAATDAQLAMGTAGVLAAGWAYSAPPLRLKGRPGADVAVNALVVGLLAPLCGWSLHQPVLGYPPVLAAAGTLIAAALYLPTTVIDMVADARAGDVTFAVRFGPRTTYAVAVAMWGAGTSLWLAACLNGLVPPGHVPFHVIGAAALTASYAALMRRPSIPRLAILFTAFGAPVLAFLGAVVAGVLPGVREVQAAAWHRPGSRAWSSPWSRRCGSRFPRPTPSPAPIRCSPRTRRCWATPCHRRQPPRPSW